MKNFILGFLVLVLIGGVAVGSYFIGKQQSKLSFNLTPTPEPTKAVSSPSPIVTTTLSVSPQQNSHDIELIKQALIKKNNWTNIEIEITTTYNDGTYAKGGVTEKGSEAGGGYFFAKKVNGEWKIVADGNDIIACESLVAYPDYPASLIPECYDSESGTTKKR